MFSVATIAFSYAAISKNNTIAEKNEVINQKEREILDKNKTIAEKENELDQQNTTISSLKEQLSNKEDEVKAYKQRISEKEEEMGIQAALGKALTSTKEAFISGRVNRIVKDGLKNAYDAILPAHSTREIFSGTCDTSVKYAKDALNSVTSSLKSIYSVTSIFPVLGRSSENTKS